MISVFDKKKSEQRTRREQTQQFKYMKNVIFNYKLEIIRKLNIFF